MSVETTVTDSVLPGPQPPYPLHKSVASLLDPEYVEFYNKYIINQQQVHYQPVAASRTSGVLIPGAGPAQPVASTEDYAIKRQESEGPDVMVRVFTPEGEKPAEGWPVMIWYHGGGWVLGNINTENVVCTHLCSRAKCVVVSVDYRLAPEDPFPAAVHDSWEAIRWLQHQASDILPIDLGKVALGGSSAGGNLAAIMAQRALTHNGPSFLTQLLIVPVTDNTATTDNNSSYSAYENTAALPAVKMLWYRRHYLPNESDWTNPEASPLFWQGDWSKLPRGIVIVGELDVLRSEGEQFAAKLRDAGVKVDLTVQKGMPHPFLAMDGVLEKGRATITAMCEELKAVF